jgi:chorismate synthase
MERASARETAARVAAGALAASLLRAAGIEVFAHVCRIGAVAFAPAAAGSDRAAVRDASSFYSLDPRGDDDARALVDAAREKGDTVGGLFQVEASGLPPGLGSHVQWDARLDGRLAQALMSIPGIKGVEVGAGFASATTPGLELHDPIESGKGGEVRRPSNRAGGIEGGMTNGEPVVVRAAMKPIPTVGKPLPSVDLSTGRPAEAVYERSDVCSVPAASVVGEAMVALVLLDAALEVAGAPTFAEFVAGLAARRERARFKGSGLA